MKQEIIEMRTRNSKTIDNGDGTRTLQLRKHGLHYLKDGHYEDIDTTIVNGSMSKAGYHFDVNGNKVKFSKDGDWIEFEIDKLQWSCEAGQALVSEFKTDVTGIITGNEIRWDNAFGPGIHLLYGCSPDGIYKKVILDDYIEPPAHLINEENLLLEIVLKYQKSNINVKVDGKEESFNTYQYVRVEKVIFGNNKFEFVVPHYWDSGIGSAVGHRIITKNTIKTGVMHSWLIKAIFPVYIDTDVNEQVGASTDDCQETNDGSVDLTDTLIWIYYTSPYGGNHHDGGLRWTTVAVPKDATINSATLSLYLSGDEGGLISTIKGIDEDNTATWSSGSRPSQRTKTTATVQANQADWGNWGVGNWITRDISSIISEITSRASWTSNNALGIVIEENCGDYDGIKFRSWDYSGNAHGAKLDISYTVPPTKTFTIDAILEATQTKEFSVDAILEATEVKEFTVDALLVKTGTKEFSIDALLETVYNKEFTVDVILEATEVKEFNIDSYLVERLDKEFIIDVLLEATLSKDFSIDAILIEELRHVMTDDFNDNSLDMFKWTESPGAGSLVAEQNQRLELISTASNSGFVRTTSKYTVKNTILRVKVTSASTDGGIKLTTTFGNGANWPAWDIYEEANYYNFQLIAGPKLKVTRKKAGAATVIGTSGTLSLPYYARIRTDDTTVYFEHSSDGNTWTTICSEVWDLADPITDHYYAFLTSYNTPTTGVSHMDDFSIQKYKDFTVDGYLVDRLTKEFSIDAKLVVLHKYKEFSIDGYLVDRLDKTFTVDSYLVNRLTKEFTVDSYLVERLDKEFSVDAILEATETKDFSIDSILEATYSKEFSVDAILKATETKTFSIDGLLEESGTKTFTIDALLEATLSKDFSIDGYLVATEIKDFTVDCILEATQSKEFSADAILEATQSKEFSIDVLLKSVGSKEFNINGIIKAIETKDFSVDGVLEATQTKEFSTDGYLVDRLSKDFSIDSILVNRLSKEFTLDGSLVDRLTKEFSIDVLLEVIHTKDFTVDGMLKSVVSKDFSTDGILKATQSKEFTVDGTLVRTWFKEFSIDALLVRTGIKTFTIDAEIGRSTKYYIEVLGSEPLHALTLSEEELYDITVL